jgi:zinc transporter ZupT
MNRSSRTIASTLVWICCSLGSIIYSYHIRAALRSLQSPSVRRAAGWMNANLRARWRAFVVSSFSLSVALVPAFSSSAPSRCAASKFRPHLG